MNPPQPDQYDEAIAYLRSFTGEDEFEHHLYKAWNHPEKNRNKAGILFSRVCPPDGFDNDCTFGCLTQIRGDYARAYTPELTARIKADTRIPTGYDGITRENLDVFAEWQRALHVQKAVGQEDITLCPM